MSKPVLVFPDGCSDTIVQRPNAQQLRDAHKQYATISAWEQSGRWSQKELQREYLWMLVSYPWHVSAWINLGVINYEERDFQESYSNFHKALELDSERCLTCFNLANACEELGKFGEAFDNYERAITLNPCYSFAHFNLALLHQKVGNSIKALQCAERYHQLEPDAAGKDVLKQAWRIVAQKSRLTLVSKRPAT